MKSVCAVAAAVALGLVACGDDDDEESAGPASETVTVTETEFKIDPAEVEIEIDQAGVVEFKVENAGSVTHALEVESEDLEEETEEIAPGESATLRVELEAGAYELYCPIGDHEQQGMTGELIVAGGGGASSDEDSGGAEAPSSDDDPGY